VSVFWVKVSVVILLNVMSRRSISSVTPGGDAKPAIGLVKPCEKSSCKSPPLAVNETGVAPVEPPLHQSAVDRCIKGGATRCDNFLSLRLNIRTAGSAPC
jgi:hypothetical protein